MKKIAILTSGGDAPGMNAAIRAAVRCGHAAGHEMVGVRHGFRGLLDAEFESMGPRSVSNILQRGGTVLSSSRCPEFAETAAQQQALANLGQHGIDGLVVIGGNGSQCGAHALSTAGLAVVGVASTIDNDLFGSEPTIGVDTALNVALQAVDQLKVTASSHRRASIIEVMGRDCGYLALMLGLAGGAEAIVIPEIETTPDEVAAQVRQAYDHGKSHALVVVAEGAPHAARALESHFQSRADEIGFDLRVTVLGHIQRGGTPTVFDRILATRLAAAAIDHLVEGRAGVLLGRMDGTIRATPLATATSSAKPLDASLFELARKLAD